MPHKSLELDDNDEIMRHCRQVREARDRRFKTVDALCDYYEKKQKESHCEHTAKRTIRRVVARRPAPRAACRAVATARASAGKTDKPHRNLEWEDDNEIMRHCRKVRDELNRRYNTVDKMWAYIMSLEKEGGRKRATKLATRRAIAAKRPPNLAAKRAAARRATPVAASHPVAHGR